MEHLKSGRRQPALPSGGGLLSPSFVYRKSDKTDVRVTWARARAQLLQTGTAAEHSH